VKYAISASSWPGESAKRVFALDVPAIHALFRKKEVKSKTWMPGIADKFTQSAQGRLLWPGMTTI
jgi:hypothetical protein